MYLDQNFGLRVSLSESPSPNSKLAKFGLSDLVSKITLLFDLSLDLDQTLA